MIKLTATEGELALTNDQFSTIHDLIDEFGWALDYEVVEYEGNPERKGVVHLWVHHQDSRPTRHHIDIDGEVFLNEDVDWDWKGTTE